MSGHGRTSWYGEDAAWHRRELIIELGDEFGPAALAVMKVLRAWTQEQVRGSANPIRGGFRGLAREAFTDAETVRAVIERAAAIGALDDLVLEEDERRFVLRVSGWVADQDRSRAAFRKQAQRERNADTDADSGGVVTPERDMSQKPGPDRDTSRSVTPSSIPNLTSPDLEEQRVAAPGGAPTSPSLPRVNYRGKRVDGDTVAAAVRLLEVFNGSTGRQLGATGADGRPSPALKQIVGAMIIRPQVSGEQWEAAIRRTVTSPPSWVEGPLQLGHVFGERAAEHALANGSTGNGTSPLAKKYEGLTR